ncbi:hypothetical protein RZE82_07230 [Mollicutes bacterium LVI A0039]|nr:hypothetical protein RZE82_07230 [Mollicutes bacterium LVI A0039]
MKPKSKNEVIETDFQNITLDFTDHELDKLSTATTNLNINTDTSLKISEKSNDTESTNIARLTHNQEENLLKKVQQKFEDKCSMSCEKIEEINRLSGILNKERNNHSDEVRKFHKDRQNFIDERQRTEQERLDYEALKAEVKRLRKNKKIIIVHESQMIAIILLTLFYTVVLGYFLFFYDLSKVNSTTIISLKIIVTLLPGTAAIFGELGVRTILKKKPNVENILSEIE